MTVYAHQLSSVYHVIYMIIVFLWYMSTGILQSMTELACRILHDPGACCDHQHVARSDSLKLKDQKFNRSGCCPSVWLSSVCLAITHRPLDMFHMAA